MAQQMPLGNPISFTLPRDLGQQLDKLASAMNTSRSAIVREALARYVIRHNFVEETKDGVSLNVRIDHKSTLDPK
jgi:predicted transcriptional regulator